MSTIIYLFEFQLPMCSLNPEFLKRDCGTIPVAEIISGKIEIFSKLFYIYLIIINLFMYLFFRNNFYQFRCFVFMMWTS
jgi:hypothetical protein